MKNLPLVSITITAKNEEKNIASCLQSIKNQTYPQNKIEIIVVDNNSIDKTKNIAKKYTSKVYNFGPERSRQRNFGMLKKSKGKYLLFLDADMNLSPFLIQKAVDKLETSSLIGLYIPEIIIGSGFWTKARSFERSFYNATVIDCVRTIKKNAFQKSGGFDTSLTGPEDWDLNKKIKKLGQVDVLNKKKAVIYHNETDFNLKNYLKKKAYYSKSFKKYIKKWGKDDKDIKKQFSFYYRYFVVFIEKSKWKRLIKHPLLSLRMIFLRIAVGLTFLSSKIKN